MSGIDLGQRDLPPLEQDRAAAASDLPRPPAAADGSDWRADVRELVEDGMDTHDVVGVGVRAADRGTFVPYAIPLGFIPFRPAVLEEIELYRDAPVWEPEAIAEATADWFRYLGDDRVPVEGHR